MKIYAFFASFFIPTFLVAKLHYVDFDTSMNLTSYRSHIDKQHMMERIGIDADALLNFFRELYNNNNFLKATPSKNPRIPKIIHQIWIGPSVPQKFTVWIASWREKHPDWEYHLWTQEDIASREWYNADLLKKSRNPGETSDIMRYEILYNYGGVYIDMDFQCLQSLEELHYLYDFYIGIQPLDSELVQLGIGIIGAAPGHPMLKSAIEHLHSTCTDPRNFHHAPAKSGPIFLTKIFFAHAGRTHMRDIALPAHYFYPLGCKQENYHYEVWREQGSFGVHHWAKSWLLPEFRKEEFRILD